MNPTNFMLAAFAIAGALMSVPNPPVVIVVVLVFGFGIACFLALALTIAPAKRRNTKPSTATAQQNKRTDAKAKDNPKEELAGAMETIAKLRETGKRAVAQSEQWEAAAKALQKELADLRRQNGQSDHKFEEAKRAFAKLYHPNAAHSGGALETMLRGEIFKEFWAELERIEAKT
jgi:hypothetical protein